MGRWSRTQVLPVLWKAGVNRERYLRTKEGRELERDMVGDNSVTYCLENGFTLANPACPGEVNLT